MNWRRLGRLVITACETVLFGTFRHRLMVLMIMFVPVITWQVRSFFGLGWGITAIVTICAGSLVLAMLVAVLVSVLHLPFSMARKLEEALRTRDRTRR